MKTFDKSIPYDVARPFRAQTLAWAVGVHALAVAALLPQFFRWDALIFATVTALAFGYALGLFHHMYLTHDSFRAVRPLAYLGALMGTLTWRGPFAGPVRYVAMHRVHHEYADDPVLDPHTPVQGWFFSLLGWFWRQPRTFTRFELYEPFARDVAADPYYRFLDRNVNALQFGWALICAGIGAAVSLAESGTVSFGVVASFVLAGVGLRTVIALYLMNMVDLVNHTVGYRNFDTKDHSTNSPWMAFVHLGGAVSWHNNHHGEPDYFTVKARRWEIDAHYMLLQALQSLGLVSHIKKLDLTKAGATSPEAA